MSGTLRVRSAVNCPLSKTERDRRFRPGLYWTPGFRKSRTRAGGNRGCRRSGRASRAPPGSATRARTDHGRYLSCSAREGAKRKIGPNVPKRMNGSDEGHKRYEWRHGAKSERHARLVIRSGALSAPNTSNSAGSCPVRRTDGRASG